MKRQLLTIEHDSYPSFMANQEDTAKRNDQANVVEARRQYYYTIVLKPDGIPNPAYIQKSFSREERQERAQAFTKRNQSLKYFIGLIQQKVVI